MKSDHETVPIRTAESAVIIATKKIAIAATGHNERLFYLTVMKELIEMLRQSLIKQDTSSSDENSKALATALMGRLSPLFEGLTPEERLAAVANIAENISEITLPRLAEIPRSAPFAS